MKIFWSWQSDAHQSTNRHFVRGVLADLARSLNGVDDPEDSERPPSDEEDEDSEIDAEDESRIALDHDTLGVGGSPRIAEKILEKIEAAAVFVADVTPICTTAGGKRVPNPNVMIELGYAMKVLGEERVVLVGNLAEGAGLKYLPFDLRHRKAPAFFSLQRDATEERMAEVAVGLKAELRNRIVPGLRLAEKVMREDRRRSDRMPELAIVLVTETDDPISISQSPRMTGVSTLEEITAETPLLPVPKLPAGGRKGTFAIDALIPTRRGMLDLTTPGVPKPPHRWTPEETEGYNVRVRQYHAAHQSFLSELGEFRKLVLRSFQVKLALENNGTLPATGIDADIYFPETIRLYDEDDHTFPTGPTAPKPPKKEPAISTRAFAVHQPVATLLDPTRYLPRSTRIYPTERRVHVSAAELKHHHQFDLDPFVLSFVTERDIASFEARYVITANEPLDPIEGVISFEVVREEADSQPDD